MAEDRVEHGHRYNFCSSRLREHFSSQVSGISESPARNSDNTATPLHPWVWPDAPWRRIHIDYARPFLGKMFFVVVDAHSK